MQLLWRWSHADDGIRRVDDPDGGIARAHGDGWELLVRLKVRDLKRPRLAGVKGDGKPEEPLDAVDGHEDLHDIGRGRARVVDDRHARGIEREARIDGRLCGMPPAVKVRWC